MGKKHCNVALFVPHAGCPHQCSFCNQRVISGESGLPTDDEVRAACDKALLTRKSGAEDAEIAFFGGSFTAIPREEMCRLLEAAAPYVRNGRFAGIRLSTRPDAIDENIVRLLKGYGVTTVELGAQSMNDAILRNNGRGHTAAQVEEASRCIRQGGLSLGLQMMTGLPGDTDDGARETARRLAALGPDNVRIYPTLVLEHTELAERWRRGEYRPQTLEEAVSLCAELLTFWEERDIPVIRLGLHAEQELTQRCLAGPFHPAFRELCESHRWLERMKQLATQVPPGPVTFHVAPAVLSQVLGQHHQNREALRALGYTAVVVADETVPQSEIRREK